MLSLFIYYIKNILKNKLCTMYVLYLFAIFHFIVYVYRPYINQRQTTFQFIM